MPHLTSLIICAFQGRLWHATSVIDLLCVLSKGYDEMPCSMSFNHVYFPRAMIGCHARRCLTVYAIQGLRRHAMPDFVRPCGLSKGDNGMPHPMLSDLVYGPNAMMECHSQNF